MSEWTIDIEDDTEPCVMASDEAGERYIDVEIGAKSSTLTIQGVRSGTPTDGYGQTVIPTSVLAEWGRAVQERIEEVTA